MNEKMIERPTLIIGLGGLGKHVLTHVKHRLYGKFENKMPDNVAIFSMDTANIDDARRPEIKTVNKWTISDFSLDYDERSEEFVHFGGHWGKPVLDIAKQPNPKVRIDPFISGWLKKDDAERYHNMTEEDLSVKKGVGQKRQASRVCLFLKLKEQEFVENLKRTINRVDRYSTKDRPLRVIIIGSIAGGTSCGALLDISILIHHLVSECEFPSQFIGLITLVKGFEGLKSSRDITSDDYKRMEANSFAAFRELERLMFIKNSPYTIDYSDQIKSVKLKDRLFDVLYFIDGSTLSYIAGRDAARLQHSEGIVPATADFLYMHLIGLTDDYSNISTALATNFDNAEKYPRDGAVYSSFGIHRLIFDAQGIMDMFAPNLAWDVIDHFIDQKAHQTGSSGIEQDVLDFLSSTGNTPFNHTVSAQLNSNDAIKTNETYLLGVLRFGGIRPLQVNTVDYNSIETSALLRPRPSSDVIKDVDNLSNRQIGIPDQKLGANDKNGTLYAVLNYLYEENQKKYFDTLKQAVEKLADGEKSASLLYTLEFLNELLKKYESFSKHIDALAKTIKDKKDVANKQTSALATELQKTKSGAKQKVYIQARSYELQWMKIEIILGYFQKLTGAHFELAEKIRDDVEGYVNAFKNLKDIMSTMIDSVRQVRRNTIKNYPVRTYVTKPDDPWENRLYALMLDEIPNGHVENKLCEILPKIDKNKVIKEFTWKVSPNAEFTGFLSSDYVPSVRQTETNVWNFAFVKKMIELGHLNKLIDLNIFDILAWTKCTNASMEKQKAMCNTQAIELLNHLKKASEASISYDSSIHNQPSNYGVSYGVHQNTWKIYAPWKPSEPGSFISDVLFEHTKNSNDEYKESIHEIVAKTTMHYLRMPAMPNISNLENSYLEHLRAERFPPLHNFLAEKNATRYETMLVESKIPGINITSFCPQVTSLLEYEDDLIAFTRAYVLKKLKQELDNNMLKWQYSVEYQKRTHIVWLENTILKSAGSFIASDAILKSEFVKLITNEWNIKRKDFQNDIVSLSGKTLIDELYDEITKLRDLALGKNVTAVERDLYLVMSLVLENEIALLEKIRAI